MEMEMGWKMWWSETLAPLHPQPVPGRPRAAPTGTRGDSLRLREARPATGRVPYQRAATLAARWDRQGG